MTAAYEYGRILKKAGDHRGAAEAYRVVVAKSRALMRRNNSGYFKGKEFRSLLEMAESQNELGDAGAALASARESLDVARKWVGYLGDGVDVSTAWRHGVFFMAAGRLLARMGRADEAERVFRESEQSFLKVLAESPGKIANRQTLAVLYLTMGDFYSGLGICRFGRHRAFGGIGDSDSYCPPDGNAPAGRARTRKGREYYQKAVELLARLEAENAATDKDRENLRVGRERAASLAGNPNGRP